MVSACKIFTIALELLKPLTSLTQSEMKLKTHLAFLRLPWFDSLRPALGCLKLLPGVLKILNVDAF